MQIVWHGSSKDDLLQFPEDAKSEAGYQLRRVQDGREPSNWKPMKSVGAGVREIRIFEESGTFRVIYVVKTGNTLHVLHAFQKKTQKTPPHDIQLAKKRFSNI
jgi:phage-related protein